MYVGWMHHVGKGPTKISRRLSVGIVALSRRNRREWSSLWPRSAGRRATATRKSNGSREPHLKGSPPALYELGRAYWFGSDVAEDRQKSWSYYEEAARLRHVFARRRIASEMLKGRRGIWCVPVGLFVAVNALMTIVRVVRKYPLNPPHDLLLRVDGPPIVPRP